MTFPLRSSRNSLSPSWHSIVAGLFFAVAFANAASAQTPSASQLAAAREVVLSSGISRSFAIFVPQLMQQMTETLTKTRPELSSDLAVVLKQLEPEFQAHQSQIVDEAARIYATSMSEQELQDIANFFKSPAGKKYVDTQPAILDQVVVAIQNWTQALSNDMMERVRAEMKKKGHDI